MDPDALWHLLCEELNRLKENPRDREHRVLAISLLQALTEWLRRGGFPPTIS